MRLLAVLLLLTSPLAAQNPDPRVAQARQRIAAADLDGAVELLEALVLEGEDPAAWMLLGRALALRGEREAAIGAYEAACEHEAVAAFAHFAAARLYALEDFPDDAFAHLEEAIAKGFQSRGSLTREPDLEGLRADARWRPLVASLPSSSSFFTEEPRILHTFDGESPGDVFGWIGRDLGDADGDGKSDLLISAPYRSAVAPGAGKIYVYSGASGALLFARDGEAGDQLGIGIESAGDVNGDGRMDALAGASCTGGSSPRPGKAFVYSGKDGSTLLALEGSTPGDEYGRKVSGGVDFDGDGHDDVLIGAPGAGPGLALAGSAFVCSGKTGMELARIDGELPGDRFGAGNAVWAGAGKRLLAIGAANAGDGDRGRAYVYEWEDGAPRLAFTIDNDETGVALGGMFVSFPGDMTGDGISEVYASDWQNNAQGSSSGRVYLHDGASGERLYVLSGKSPGIGFGTCTADVGDVTGDGIADLLVGAWQAPDAAPGGGKCWLYAGAPRAEDVEVLATYTCNVPGETLGFDTTGVGDLDGDGGVDFLVTGGYSSVSGQRSGRAFVIAGPVFASK